MFFKNSQHSFVNAYFFFLQEEAQDTIANKKLSIEEEKNVLSSKLSELQDVMTYLKADLYAKFGNNINLEADED